MRDHLHADFPFADRVVVTNAAGALVDLYNQRRQDAVSQEDYDVRSAEIKVAVGQSHALGNERYDALVSSIIEDPGFRIHMHGSVEHALREVEEFVSTTDPRTVPIEAEPRINVAQVEQLGHPAPLVRIRR